MKIGLVLSGGAAKGAYHVGILKALAEHNIEVNIYGGASIGALNAVLAASSCNIEQAYERLNSIWQQLSADSPLKINNKAVAINIGRALATLVASYPNPLAKKAGTFSKVALGYLSDGEGLIDDQPIIDKFDQYVDLENKVQWSDVWVSTFEGTGFEAGVEFLKNEFGIEGKKASYHELKKLSNDVLLETLMASAALPLLYQSRTIDGNTHYDGGVRDNTPIKPLIGKCDICFVSHLSNGSSFDRNEYSSDFTTIIEIRPSDNFVTEQGVLSGVKSMMNFEQDKVDYLAIRGYEDTCSVIENLKRKNKLENQIEYELDEINNLLDEL